MDETEVLLYLDDPSYNKREQTLDQLRKAVRTNSGGSRRLPFSDPVTLFRSLSLALADAIWETRYQCIKLISELVPVLGDDLDQCMQLVLPQLVSLLAHSKVTLSNAASQALNAYANYTYDFQLVLHGIIRHGIQARDTTIKKSVIKSISFLLTEDHKDRNLAALVESLVERLCDNSIIDNDVQESIQFALEKIADLVGQDRFDAYFEGLSDSLRERYHQLVGKEADGNGDQFHSEVLRSRSQNWRSMPVSASNSANSLSRHVPLDSNATMMYGIIPEHIVTRLSEENSVTDQIKAIEEMKRVVRDPRHLNALLPHMGAYFDFLKKLLDDKSGIVSKTIMALEIIEILVDRLGVSVEDYLRQVCSAVTKQMPETNISVRSLIVRIALRLMQILPPRTVLPVLLENLSHKNFHVRQVTLNVIIASLLTHPSNDFDLGKLCQALVHMLIDPKKLVRQASLECFAVIAQAMGTGKQQQLIAAVDSLEQTSDADGVMAAVQARLARRQLPTFSDNIVEYATQAALNASRDGSGVQMMVDIDWILSGSNSSLPSGRPGPWDSFDKQSVSSVPSGRIWTRVSSEDQMHQSRYAERAFKSGTISKVSDSGKPLRHHNSAQFPLRGSERSPDRGLTGRGSALDFWELNSSRPPPQSPPPSPAAPPSHPGSSNPRMTLSMTWPSAQLFQDYANDPPAPDPIFRNQGSGQMESEFHPFHTKPQPVRTQSSSKKAAAAAGGSLPLGHPSSAPFRESQTVANGNRFPETSSAKSDDDVVEVQDEMNSSLKQIRHSASKKQLNKFFEKQESRESLRRASQQKSQDDKEFMDKADKGGTSDVVPEPTGVLQAPRKRVTGPVASYYHPDNSISSEFNPLSGVTFRDNPNSDVAVVGRGYAADDDANPLLSIHRSSPAMMQTKKNKDRRRFQKAVPLSPLDSAGMPVYGSSSYDGLTGPVGIVGKGLPPSVASDSLTHSPSYPGDVGPSPSNNLALGDERPIRPTRPVKVSASLPSAVYGSAVKSDIGSSSNYESSEYLSSDSSTVSSRSIYERNDRQRGVRPGAARKQTDADRLNNPHHLQRFGSKERRQGHPSANGDAGDTEAGIDEADGDTSDYSRVKSSTTADTGFEDGLVDDIPSRQPKRRQKRKKQHSSDLETLKMSNYLNDDDDDDNVENTAALGNPAIALNQALRYLTQEQWEEKLQGLSLIRRLAFHHQEVLVPELGRVLLAVCAEVKNLRSRVSCEAIVCLSDMFTHLKKSLDLDLDRTVSVLLSKTGDQSSQFMREEAEKALVSMVENVTAQKAVSSLITGGASSRSVHIRTMTAQMLERVVDRLGPEKVLSGNREMLDKILPISAQFLQDASPDVRYSGQRIFHILMFHQDFDRLIKKSISETLLRSIQDKLEAVRQKGPTESGLGSSRTRRTPMIESRGSNRGGSAPVNSVDGSLPPVNSAFSTSSAGKKKTPGRVDDTTFIEIQAMELNLSSTNWRERCNGVEQLQQLAETNPAALSSCLTKIFSKYIPCLHDSNVKLNLYALQVLNIITPSIARPLASSAVLNLTVQTVISNLASKNEEIFSTTSAVLDGFENYIDPFLLLAPFISEAKKGKATIKSKMTLRISGLVSKIDQRRTNQALAQILPFIWHLLSQLITNTGGGRLRAPATQLVNNMQQLMGENGLISAAKTASTVTLPMQELLQELLIEVA